MKNAIIIFVRNPVLGKVKTRLAKDIGSEKALQVYKKLLQHTHTITADLDCDKFVYYADGISEHDIWENSLYKKKVQQGENLGDRMMAAFFELFQQGYTKIIIIGSDCPDLSGFIVLDAFDKLNEAEVVIGPSSDGGYYLLGMIQYIPDFFRDKAWSTDKVLSATLLDAVRLGKRCQVITELADIDTAEDLLRYQNNSKKEIGGFLN